LAVSKITGNPLLLSDAATIGIVAGSVFPDVDILLQKWGDYVYLKNHRGITHSIPGLVISSLLIGAALSLIYQNTSFVSIFLWTLLGSFSHVIFDLFNSYGAKLLWPLSDRKFSIGMLVSFDPVLIISLAGFVFFKNGIDYMLLAALPVYLLLKAGVRHWALMKLKARYGDRYEKISLLPAITKPFRWHLILHGKERDVIGEKKLFRNKIRVVRTMEKAEDKGLESVMLSETGRFFSEFTPLCHVACEKDGEIDRYVFSDMRYYLKDDFLHHAVVEVDKNNQVVSQTFNPYSLNRSCTIPS
jgi:inner membrane protein